MRAPTWNQLHRTLRPFQYNGRANWGFVYQKVCKKSNYVIVQRTNIAKSAKLM